jgi:hypothetical protein
MLDSAAPAAEDDMNLKMLAVVSVALLAAVIAGGQIPHTVPPGTADTWVFENGNDLFQRCNSSLVSDQTFCMGYIVGAADLVGLEQVSNGPDNTILWKFRSVCAPQGVTVQQIKDVVLKYMRDNPERRADSGASLVVQAISQAWVCPKQ